jgi:hypothetical protein
MGIPLYISKDWRMNMLLQEREECPYEAGGEEGKIFNKAAAPGSISRFLIVVLNSSKILHRRMT